MKRGKKYGMLQLSEGNADDEGLAPNKQRMTSLGSQIPQVAILTGGFDKPYALGLASSLIAHGVAFEFIGSDEIDGPQLHHNPLVRFLNLRGNQRSNVSVRKKVARVIIYYLRLFRYAVTAEPKIFHILWSDRFHFLDRALLPLFYRLLGRHIVLTVHNVNSAKRDGNDSMLNRLTLRTQYHLVDHLFVHTEQMKRELATDFMISDRKISVIPFGINSTVPNTDLTTAEAKDRLGLTYHHKALLFFGNIAPYKGLEYLVEAMSFLPQDKADYRLIIAGRLKECAPYWSEIQRQIARANLEDFVIKRIEYIPDEETEIFFKAADVLVLPYKHIFQSGVLFLGYNFGLPAIASDVGSLKEEILEGETGLITPVKDPESLARTIQEYFESDLYNNLEVQRAKIRRYADNRYSWAKVATLTTCVYSRLLGRRVGKNSEVAS